MELAGKYIGIWGYGIGGKAAADFITARGAHVLVFDNKTLSADEQKHLHAQNARVCTDLQEFLQTSSLIIPSAGIDLKEHHAYKERYMSELDIFSSFFKKPIIAITGSLGKTTVTTLISKLLERAGKRVLVGGNIGIGMCSLITQQDTVDYAVLEVSSFQLELCKFFKPHVALWTNFYPNHLDRHSSIDEYFMAKCKIFAHQHQDDWAIMPSDVHRRILQYSSVTAEYLPLPQQIPNKWTEIINKQSGFESNWLAALTALDALNIAPTVALEQLDVMIQHRLEPIATVEDVTFYNDSKATIAQATIAAVECLQKNPIILLLGGLSKGVDRQPLVSALRDKVAHIICFGVEAERLAQWCEQEHIPHTICAHFDEIALLGYTYGRQKNASVLLSPGGSSFDLFKDYQERGMRFKELVLKLKDRT